MAVEPRTLPHEIWEDSWADPDDSWHLQTGICLAGPFGDGFRRALSPRARLLTTFDAGSPGEALAFVKRFTGRDQHAREDRSFQNPSTPPLNDGLVYPDDGGRRDEPYPDWMHEDDDEQPAPRVDPTHPLWDFDLDG